MTNFYRRPADEQALIGACYDFEVWGIRNTCSDPNPYYDALMALPDGAELWEAIGEAVSDQFAD